VLALRLSWRTWIAVALQVLVALAVGVIALTPDASWLIRIGCGAWFLLGAYWVLDAVVFARSWRFTDRALHIPSLLSRRREISGDPELVVELVGRRPCSVQVTGPRGSRRIAANPLVSARDLRRWFDAVPDD